MAAAPAAAAVPAVPAAPAIAAAPAVAAALLIPAATGADNRDHSALDQHLYRWQLQLLRVLLEKHAAVLQRQQQQQSGLERHIGDVAWQKRDILQVTPFSGCQWLQRLDECPPVGPEMQVAQQQRHQGQWPWQDQQWQESEQQSQQQGPGLQQLDAGLQKEQQPQQQLSDLTHQLELARQQQHWQQQQWEQHVATLTQQVATTRQAPDLQQQQQQYQQREKDLLSQLDHAEKQLLEQQQQWQQRLFNLTQQFTASQRAHDLQQQQWQQQQEELRSQLHRAEQQLLEQQQQWQQQVATLQQQFATSQQAHGQQQQQWQQREEGLKLLLDAAEQQLLEQQQQWPQQTSEQLQTHREELTQLHSEIADLQERSSSRHHNLQSAHAALLCVLQKNEQRRRIAHMQQQQEAVFPQAEACDKAHGDAAADSQVRERQQRLQQLQQQVAESNALISVLQGELHAAKHGETDLHPAAAERDQEQCWQQQQQQGISTSSGIHTSHSSELLVPGCKTQQMVVSDPAPQDFASSGRSLGHFQQQQLQLPCHDTAYGLQVPSASHVDPLLARLDTLESLTTELLRA